MAEQRPSFFRRHRWLVWLSCAAVAVLAALGIAAAIVARRFEPFLRAEIVAALSRHFHARVELDTFHVSVVKGIEAEGKGLRVWPSPEATNLQTAEAGTGGNAAPLITLDKFQFHAPLRYKSGEPMLIHSVELKGLKVDVPPRRPKPKAGTAADREDGGAPVAALIQTPAAKSGGNWLSFLVESVVATDTVLKLETNKPGKLPLEFDIAHLKLTDLASNGTMKFDADLTNPRPVGQIHSTGSFGPWRNDDPGESPVSGGYTFQHADLSIFKGIAGILDSTGRYQGTLRNLVVDGETSMPDFRLTNFGNPMPLKTTFHAKVDGTNGDTWLEPVDATLGRSHFTAQGQIVRVAEQVDGKLQPRGRDIALKVNVDKARIEDFLDLAGKPGTTRQLTGDVLVKASLHIPPGKDPVLERMELEGDFHLDGVRFTSQSIQDKIRSLSVRGQGRPGEVKQTDADSIESQMAGKFKLASSIITLPELEYMVPGAEIDLAGSYALEGGAIKFDGKAKMEATVSAMVGGWKGLLLKPADRYFKKDGAGTEVPVHIAGTREAPEFEVDVGKVKLGVQKKQEQKPAASQDATPEQKPQQ